MKSYFVFNWQARIAELTEKRNKLKSTIELDEDALLNYLEKSAQMEKDNIALMKYASEDDSKINVINMIYNLSS